MHTGKSATGVTALALVLLLTSCAYQHYHPVPLSPAQTAASLRARSLQDPNLRAFIEKNLGHKVDAWPMRQWNMDTLTLAAFYFNPTLEVARAQLATVEAGKITAAQRPNPSFGVAPGGETSSPGTPWLFNLGLGIPFETAGKRGHRERLARNAANSAEIAVAQQAWKVRSQLRATLLDYIDAQRSVELLRLSQQTNEEVVQLLQARLSEGEIARPELDAARADLSSASVQLRAAEGRMQQTRTALAAAIGVSVAALNGLEFTWRGYDDPPKSFSEKEIQRDAVLNRMDIRAALANYAVAEASLRLEIANQYPNVVIGPTYTFEEGKDLFTLAVDLVLPVFNHNQGPVAEAMATRKEMAARFVAVQANAIGASENALATYHASLQELRARQDFLKIQEEREKATRRQQALGAADRLAVETAVIQTLTAKSTVAQAMYRAQAALGALEDAVQRPLEPASTLTIAPGAQALQEGAKRETP